jgi:hypothetical protein
MTNAESTKKLTSCEAYTREGAWNKIRRAFGCRFECNEEWSAMLGFGYYEMFVDGNEIGEVYDINNEETGENCLKVRFIEDHKIKNVSIYIMADHRVEETILSLKCDKTNNECEIGELKAEVENLKARIAELEAEAERAEAWSIAQQMTIANHSHRGW